MRVRGSRPHLLRPGESREIAGKFADAYEDKRNGDDAVPVLQEELRVLSRLAAEAADALDV